MFTEQAKQAAHPHQVNVQYRLQHLEQVIQSTATRPVDQAMPDESDAETTKTPAIIEELTKREQEVLELVARGYSNKEVAQSLTISDRTVNAHLRSIYVKLSVNSRSGAIRTALENHLIEL